MNRYPLWRYILLGILIVLGILYALPNFYGEDPAIQIQMRNGSALPAGTIEKVKTALNAQKISYLSIVKSTTSNNLLVRFADSTTQLKAQPLLQVSMGAQFTVALNLAPKTPKWLLALGATPMKLGLDLRGGIHFLMRIDTKSMLAHREKNDMTSMGTALREARIRYAGSSLNGPQSFVIRFRTAADRDAAVALLTKNYLQDYTFTNETLNGQPVLRATVKPETLIKWQQSAVTQFLTILRNRVNALGVSEPVIQQQGKDQISVDLPGVQDTARAKNLIGKVATVRLQLVDTQHDAASAARSGIIPFGSTLFKSPEGVPVLLKNQVVLSGTSIIHAASIIDQNGRPAVNIRAGGSEVARFNQITRDNVGKPMATVYVETQNIAKLVNGKVVTEPKQVARIINIATINSALGTQFQIMGLESMQSAKNLALLLNSGAYPASVQFVQERIVRPTMGKANIQRGVVSMEVGSLLVILFMAFYYRGFGLVADMALVLNVVFLVAIMSLLGATLTMPGIAGIVLTVGMAVDANVLINERIREELRNGMSAQASINAGYERAFSTIVDANVTTLIVAVVLFILGSGSVQGFAVTLTIGLLTSMVTAIFFTRAVVNLVYGRRQITQLSIGIKVNKPTQR